ncbi:hypothetical protein HID58_042705, partial [Brassica napus]
LQSHFNVMGNACCVAPRDKMRRHSPTWSFRWDNNNRGRVAGEEAPLSWLSDGISRNDVSDIKPDFLSSQGSPLDSFRTQTMQKSPASDLSFPRNSSMDTVFEQKEKYSIESSAPSYPSPAQLSLSLASQPSSFPTSPLPSQIYYHPASSSTLNPTQEVSDGKICGMNSLSRSSATEEEEKGTPFRIHIEYCVNQSGNLSKRNKKKRRTDLKALTKNQAAVHIQSDFSQAFSLFMSQYLNVIVLLRWFPC